MGWNKRFVRLRDSILYNDVAVSEKKNLIFHFLWSTFITMPPKQLQQQNNNNKNVNHLCCLARAIIVFSLIFRGWSIVGNMNFWMKNPVKRYIILPKMMMKFKCDYLAPLPHRNSYNIPFLSINITTTENDIKFTLHHFH